MDDQGRPNGVGELVADEDESGIVMTGWTEHGTRRGEWVARDPGWTFCISCGAPGCADIDNMAAWLLLGYKEKVPEKVPPLIEPRRSLSRR